jgi:hypothetical protein
MATRSLSNRKLSANNRIETIISSDAAYMTYIDIERVIQDAQIYADENGITLTADAIFVSILS